MANYLTGIERMSRQRTWAQAYDLLIAFVAEHDRLPRHAETLPDGYRLGKWVSVQRNGYRANPAGFDRAKKRLLQAVPGWTWDPERVEVAWEQALDLLLAYVAEQGDLPGKGVVYRGFGLGAWVRNQRHKHLAGTLASDRAARLEQVPGWRWRLLPEPGPLQVTGADLDAPDPVIGADGRRTWESSRDLVAAYMAVHGVAPSKPTLVNGYRLGKWVNNQRGIYARGQMTPARIASLEAIPGWTWKATAA